MDFLDRKIRKKATQTICHTSKEYEEKIDLILQQIKEDNSKFLSCKKKGFRLGYAICVLAMLAFISIPTTAAIDYVKMRMSYLDEKEQEKYQETVETTLPDTEAITYIRPFSMEEQQRYDKLMLEYAGKGVFPKGELLIVDTLENVDKKSVVYENRTRTLYLPDRSLTDEELLQIIDFYHKVDYSLQQSDIVKQEKEKQKKLENALPSNEAILKEQAAQIAAYYIKAMFDVESNNVEVDYIETDISEEDGDYLCSYIDEKCTYHVVVQSSTAKLTSIDMSMEDVDFYAKPAIIDELIFVSKAQEAKRLFYNIYGEYTEIISITCSYKKDENDNVPYGNVLYYLEFEDGTAGRFSYNVNHDVFWQMIYFPNYRDMRDAEKRGDIEIEKDRVYLDIE